jgi:thiosulfate reductase cytochrome b subunit
MMAIVVNSVLGTMNEVFRALFYGDGSWLGILLLLSMCLGLLLKWKYSGVLLLPITIFLGMDYLEQNLVWHTLIMWFTTIFVLVYMVKKKG